MQIEDYFNRHRDEMNVENPDREYIWQGISQQTEQGKLKRKLIYWRIAASIVVLLGVGFFLLRQEQPAHKQHLLLTGQNGVSQQEVVLVNQINEYYKAVRSTGGENWKKTQEYLEIQEIDRLIRHYQEDLETYGPQPQIIHTLLDLYQKKIKAFDRILNEIKKQKENEDIRHI